MKAHSIRTAGLVACSVLAGALLTLAGQSFGPVIGSAIGASHAALTPPQVWGAAELKTMELDPAPDIDWSPVESGTKRNAETILFEGENVVSVWDAGPAKMIIDTPFPYDEFVVVLKGELILSDNNGNQATYGEGDIFMVSKGFVGTWDMTEEYRELIVIDTEAYNSSY